MKWNRIWMAVLVCMLVILTVNVPTVAVAAVNEEMEISPFYAYTDHLTAGLSISASGVATCNGYIQVDSPTSSISMRVNLYKQNTSGTSWVRVVGWTASCEGKYSLAINETYTVTEGTYKVVTTGAIIAEDGNYETVSVTSPICSYP